MNSKEKSSRRRRERRTLSAQGNHPMSISDAAVELVFRKIKMRKAMGEDGIHPVLLQRTQKAVAVDGQTIYDKARELVPRRFINASLRTRCIPSSCKRANIFSTPKTEPPSTEPKDYRPISLLSCLGKVMERALTVKLETIGEQMGAFNPVQARAFRTERSTIQHLLDVSYKITETDRVWRDGL
eukprot:GILJ01005766.1.p2 GENE.GILJ01005766.1~~GILJ01005766.1.p2  ORF type:complete len:184 (-),score=16.77 GILJ01005766.1:859-1410(-)